MPPKQLRIGILVPSSNTALEPLTTQIISSVPNISVHFTRLRVTTISLSQDALAQFDMSKILSAAQLLADADVDVIGWSGTSAGWLGFDVDEELCAAIRARTRIDATTSTLALNKALKMLGVRRLGLVTPYTRDVQDAIVENYAGVGVTVGAERHLGRADNVNFAALGAETFDPMVESVVRGEGRCGNDVLYEFEHGGVGGGMGGEVRGAGLGFCDDRGVGLLEDVWCRHGANQGVGQGDAVVRMKTQREVTTAAWISNVLEEARIS